MKKILLLILGFTFLHFTTFSQENRTYDGTGNNLQQTDWGATHTSLKRATTVGYSDGISTIGGTSRPNPRHISNTLFAQESLVNDPLNLSDYIWVFGQFLDHDISLTGDSDENAIISVPMGDPWFDPFGQGTAMIFMRRSEVMDGTGTSISNPRQHGNEITAFIDASNVYGSDEERANWLRTFEDGKMKVSSENLLPFNTFTGDYNTPIDPNAPIMDDAVNISEYHFVAGDVRANENPLLSSFHTLFVREHNRLCDELKIENPTWSDEQLYQHARKLVGGLIQNVVYAEWLPAMGVVLPDYVGYDETVDPSIMNVFSSAAFRLGHTLLNSVLLRLDNEGNPIAAGHLQLQEAFFNPISMLEDGGGIDPLFKGMGTQVQQAMDCKIVNDVRNFLFGPPGAGGLDLASININRGRERGIPDFNTVRANFGLPKYDSFQDVHSSPIVWAEMEDLYGDVDDIDAWVGMLSEEHMPGALLGETIMKIMEVQFAALRDGDRFYFENDPALSAEEIAEIKNTNMHDIIMRNTNITLMQTDVFEAMPHDQICNPSETSDFLGSITSTMGEEVEFVDISISSGGSMSTSNQGTFDFDISRCLEHTVTLSRTDNPANGVTGLDMVKIRAHILHLELIDDPFKLIAADANYSKEITTIDIVRMQQVILGMIPEFPNGPSWLFYEEGFEFDDPTDPFDSPLPNNTYTYTSQDDILNQNFIAVKIGDVNNSVDANTNFTMVDTRNDYVNTLLLTTENKVIKTGELVEVDLVPSIDINLQAIQFTFDYDESMLEFVDLETNNMDQFAANNYAVFEDKGMITVSYARDLFLEKNKEMLRFSFQAKQDGRLRDLLGINSSITKMEAYSSSDEIMDIQLVFEENENISDQFRLEQNQPNPFQYSTAIGFYLPKESAVELTIFDLSGRILKTMGGTFGKGNQQLKIEEKAFEATGVFYYQLKTDFGILTKKMVKLD